MINISLLVVSMKTLFFVQKVNEDFHWLIQGEAVIDRCSKNGYFFYSFSKIRYTGIEMLSSREIYSFYEMLSSP